MGQTERKIITYSLDQNTASFSNYLHVLLLPFMFFSFYLLLSAFCLLSPVHVSSPFSLCPCPDFPSTVHLFLPLLPLSPSPLRPCPRPTPTSATALCRNTTLSHSQAWLCQVVSLCCSTVAMVRLSVYAEVCVCVYERAAMHTHADVNYRPEASAGECVCWLESVDLSTLTLV